MPDARADGLIRAGVHEQGMGGENDGMMARRGVMGVLAGAAVLGGCGILGDEKSYRFRMTIEVETPQGLKTGSGVYEISARKLIALTSEEHEGSAGARGEATVVDLAGGPLFVLLKNNDAGQPLHARVTAALAPGAPLNPIASYVATVGDLGGMFASAKAELPREDWPLMVRFRDIDDPKSVEKVDPEAIGVKRIVVETTGDEVTTGIEKRLGWLGDRGHLLDSDSGPTIHPTFAQTIKHGAFWQGPTK